jgi:ABC-2 type transport system permease protein
MTTLAIAGPRPGPSLARVIGAEWTKLVGLRSSAVVVVVTAVVSGVVTYLSANASSSDPGFDPLDSLTTGLPVAVIGPLVLGVLVGTGEFSTGTFRSTFAAVPRRLPVLAAQVVVTTGLALVAAVLAVAAAVVGILPPAASRSITPDLLSEGTPQSLIGAAGFLVGAALFGLAAGALLRRTVPAMLAAIVVTLILPVVLLLASELATDPLADSAQTGVSTSTAVVNTIITFTPTGAGSLLTDSASSGVDGAPDIGMIGAGLVLAAWVLVPLGVAALRLRRRDLV